MDRLKIVRGNDFYLRIPVNRILYSSSEQKDAVPTALSMPLDECTNLRVCLLCECGRSVEIVYELPDSAPGEIVAKVPGMLKCGWYGMEISGELLGRQFRSYERKVFKIVENNGSSYVSPSVYNGESSYLIDIMWVLYACPNYPLFYIDLSDMTLRQRGTVENGEMYMDADGNLCFREIKDK